MHMQTDRIINYEINYKSEARSRKLRTTFSLFQSIVISQKYKGRNSHERTLKEKSENFRNVVSFFLEPLKFCHSNPA